MQPLDDHSRSSLRLCVLLGLMMAVPAGEFLPEWWMRLPFVLIAAVLSLSYTFKIGHSNGRRQAAARMVALVEENTLALRKENSSVVWQEPSNRLH